MPMAPTDVSTRVICQRAASLRKVSLTSVMSRTKYKPHNAYLVGLNILNEGHLAHGFIFFESLM